MSARVERFFESWQSKQEDFYSTEEMLRFAEDYHKFLLKESSKEKRKINGPTREAVRQFFDVKGFTIVAADRAFDYYTELEWYDSRGKPIKNWKSKMIAVWFKPENRKQTSESKIILKASNINDLR